MKVKSAPPRLLYTINLALVVSCFLILGEILGSYLWLVVPVVLLISSLGLPTGLAITRVTKPIVDHCYFIFYGLRSPGSIDELSSDDPHLDILDDGIVYTIGDRIRQEILWGDLKYIKLIVKANGLFAPDIFYWIESEKRIIRVNFEVPDSCKLLEVLDTLYNINGENLSSAMRATDSAQFELYKQNKTLHLTSDTPS